jgi:hypothetical protein
MADLTFDATLEDLVGLHVIAIGSAVMEITVSYVGNDPLDDTFVAVVTGEIDLTGDPITRIGRRFVCRWTPEGKFEPWMAPTTVVDLGVNVPG